MERLGMSSRAEGPLVCMPWPGSAPHLRDCSEAIEVLSMGRQMGMSSGHAAWHDGSSMHGNCLLASLSNGNRHSNSSSSSSSNGIKDGYAYYLDRGNGQLTRLIPADMLPPLNEIPAREAETRGMVVLPPLRAKGGIEMNYPVTVKTVQNALVKQAPSSVQKHIDRIVATSPSTKRTKIYCDKWIHEGVCAFTQQGCKYKHEMPFDESTQHSLGLFQGFPGWWKKKQEDLKRHSGEAAGKEIWPGGYGMAKTQVAETGSDGLEKARVAPFFWGPIGPPSKTLAGETWNGMAQVTRRAK